MFVKVALPHLALAALDYALPKAYDNADALCGCRVWVPFRKKRVLGFVWQAMSNSAISQPKLIEEIVDDIPILSKRLLEFVHWTQKYYHFQLGNMLQTIVPKAIRHGGSIQTAVWSVNPNIQFKKADAKRLQGLGLGPYTATVFRQAGWRASTVKKWIDQGWLLSHAPVSLNFDIPRITPDFLLNDAQKLGILSIQQAITAHTHQSFLLQGITGSGKTEIYLGALERCLQEQKILLWLVPEINLIAQMHDAILKNFPNIRIGIWHSQQTEKERLEAWLDMKNSQVHIILGTRSAIFNPVDNLGCIVVDEEHDLSYKQQDGLAYHGRDLAIKRAHLEGIPIVLGSATPSLESLWNVFKQRMQVIALPYRTGGAQLPVIRLINTQKQRLKQLLSEELCRTIETHLSQKHQVLIFLNRRGFAPTVLCQACGWRAECRQCDAQLVWHQQAQEMRCHHCQKTYPKIAACPQCQATEMSFMGFGTERVAEVLESVFPDYPVLRIDGDTIKSHQHFKAAQHIIHAQKASILVGTQMLAKGHHFPNLTLAAILDLDQWLFYPDFRSLERLGQLLVQVSGRVGRGPHRGEVVIQTRYPQHPELQLLLQEGYEAFSKHLLQQRISAGWPPSTALALIRAQAKTQQGALNFLQKMHELCPAPPPLLSWKPMPAFMSRKKGYYQSLWLLQSPDRAHLHHYLRRIEKMIQQDGHKVWWSIDIDPQEIF